MRQESGDKYALGRSSKSSWPSVFCPRWPKTRHSHTASTAAALTCVDLSQRIFCHRRRTRQAGGPLRARSARMAVHSGLCFSMSPFPSRDSTSYPYSRLERNCVVKRITFGKASCLLGQVQSSVLTPGSDEQPLHSHPSNVNAFEIHIGASATTCSTLILRATLQDRGTN